MRTKNPNELFADIVVASWSAGVSAVETAGMACKAAHGVNTPPIAAINAVRLAFDKLDQGLEMALAIHPRPADPASRKWDNRHG